MIIFPFIAGLLAFMCLDYVWLAIVAKKMYLQALASHVTITNGSLVPYLPAAPLVYIVGCIFLWVFVVSKADSLMQASLYGALSGFLLYGFYDFTNLATLRDYSWSITIVDILWGTVAMCVVSMVMFIVKGVVA